MKVSINPKYVIRNETKCSFIIYAGNLAQARNENGPLVSPIPPFIGFILSLFNGEEVDTTVKKVVERLDISEVKMRTFINKILNNKDAYITCFNNYKLYFPKELLIESDKYTVCPSLFHTDPFEEFIPHRLSVPAYLNLMITSKCHTNCIYCYADRSRKDDMQTQTILRVIEEAKREGVVNVVLSGGDIFSHKDWRILLKKITDSDYEPFLSTKIPLREDEVIFLKRVNIKEIQYSIDSLDPDTIQKHLRVPGNEYVSKLKAAISYCDKYGLKMNVKTVLTKFNATIEEMKILFDYFSQHNNIISWNIIPAFCSVYREDYDTYKAEKKNLALIYDYLISLRADFCMYFPHLKDKLLLSSDKRFETVDNFVKENKGCTANSYSMSVFSNGKVSVCEMLYYNDFFYIGDVNKNSIREIWGSEKALAFYHFNEPTNRNAESPCYSCTVLQTCKKSPLKKICYADIINTFGSQKWDYPDPRCPQAPRCDLEKVM